MANSTATHDDPHSVVLSGLSRVDGGPLLLVRFGWIGDRFAHRICRLDGDQESGQSSTQKRGSEPSETLLLESCEGDGQAAWPASPPLQQVDTCRLADQRQGIVAVGMAGRSHWSLSVEPLRTGLTFDVACRLVELPPSLQTTYRLHDRVEFVAQDEGGVLHFAHPTRGLQEWPVRWDPVQTEVSWHPAVRELRFAARQWPTNLPGTVRWRYEFGSD